LPRNQGGGLRDFLTGRSIRKKNEPPWKKKSEGLRRASLTGRDGRGFLANEFWPTDDIVSAGQRYAASKQPNRVRERTTRTGGAVAGSPEK